jgi:hypothetical protein
MCLAVLASWKGQKRTRPGRLESSNARFDFMSCTVYETLQGATNLTFVNVDTCCIEIADYLADDVVIARYLEISYDHRIGIGFGFCL